MLIDAVLQDALAQVQPAVVDLLQELVRCRSLGADAPGTAEALDVLTRYLQRAGIDVGVSRSAGGVPTLRARIQGARPGANILLQGHIDVVPVDVGWRRDPFAAVIEDGELHGRGACDMKAGLACFAGVMAALRAANALDQGSVTLLVDVDEETGSDRGLIPYIAEHGLADYDWAICAEPTGLRPYLGNRGLLWIRVTVDGVASHAGIPSAGRNPIPVAAEVIRCLPQDPGPAGPYGIPASALTVTTLTAGTVVNSIADKAVLTIDRRLVPGESPAEVFGDIDRAVRAVAERHSDFGISTEVTKTWPPCLVDETSPLAQAARSATEMISGATTFGFDEACNDASFLSAGGVPTVIWGPGDPDLAHTSQEKVVVADVSRAMQMYVLAIAQLKSVRQQRI
ncbi:M20 family metallopeptidase [Mycolicibacterium komossense]|uniref:M20/M25/M40 family metallo-hydrolase n=1 Tax=Mycolicibacterium komossense TaxID=1779 RepID=A0ABT3CMX6_9MYCO|nr:M20/M25/M40 family metallo-hydrolase [Mycolicibacterium komossense]MCV7230800.1 M20/M25/M40 family metallo-hydrolase [Mycolicibacterium komossense]